MCVAYVFGVPKQLRYREEGEATKDLPPGTRFVSVSVLKTGKMLSIYVMLVPLRFRLMESKWFYFYLLSAAACKAF